MNDRRPVWPWITTALLGLPLLYVVSFGPACWISERLGKGTLQLSAVYWPVIRAGNRLQLGTAVMVRYAGFGARPGATPDFHDDTLSWWYIGPGSLTPYTSATDCQFGLTIGGADSEDDPSRIDDASDSDVAGDAP